MRGTNAARPKKGVTGRVATPDIILRWERDRNPPMEAPVYM
jgi:hypothetical protein